MTQPFQPVPLPGNYDPSMIPERQATAPAPVAPAPAAPVAAPAAQPPQTLSGPGIPPELQGRPVEQVMRIYDTLKNEWLQNRVTPQAAPPAPVASAAAAPDASPSSFWSNPETVIGQEVERRVQAAVAQALGPTIIQGNMTAAKAARDATAARFPAFAAVETQVMQKLGSVDPQLLTNPKAWEQAFYLAYGEAQSGEGPPPVPQAPAPPAAAPTNTFAPTFSQPASSFFAEPGRSSISSSTNAALSPAELNVAQKFGMTAEQYVSWKGGRANG